MTCNLESVLTARPACPILVSQANNDPRETGMTKSIAKTVLFTTVKDGRTVHQWPTAVFNGPANAKAYATFLSLAHRSGDVEAARKLDKGTKVGEDGRLLPGVRFSMVTVAYEPSPDLSEDDVVSDDTPGAADVKSDATAETGAKDTKAPAAK